MRALLFCLAAVKLFVASGAATADGRHALVIANGAYEHVTPLVNPLNDGRAMEALLKKMDFKVTLKTDLDREEMGRAVSEFAGGIAEADAVLFFFSGHGVQALGSNYMVPVDAALGREGDIPFQAIRLDDIANPLSVPRSTLLMFIDACRNPFLTKGSAPASRGLTYVSPKTDAFIAFATEPGNVASDGNGTNSPFTEALLENLATPGEHFEITFQRIVRDVVTSTGGQQRPWLNMSSARSFIFLDDPKSIVAPVPVEVIVRPAPVPQCDRQYREAMASARREEELSAFVEQCPDHAQRPAVEQLLASLSDSANCERALGDSTISNLTFYLQVYPNGRCRQQVASLLDLKLGGIRNVPSDETASIAPAKSAASSTSDADARAFRQSTNRDYYGGDYRSLAADSVDNCEIACRRESECRAYSFDGWNKLCFLKSDIKEVRLDPASISGILVDHPKVRISDLPAVMHRLRNKGFPYEANRVGHEPSYEVCEKLCVDDLKCVAFSFQKAVQECRRFSNVGEYFADSSFDSGFKRQLDE